MLRVFGRVALVILGVLLWSCASEEYTSAKLYIQQEDWDQAEEFLFKALEVEPENPEVPFTIGVHVHARRQEWEQMTVMFERALALDPNRKILDGQTVQSYVDNYRTRYWANAYNAGVGYYNKYKELRGSVAGDSILQEAISAFRSAIVISPAESQTYSILATCYFESGDLERAAEEAIRSAGMAPDDAGANYAAGQILVRVGRQQEAIPYLKKAVELETANTQIIRLLATTYYDLGEKEQSIATFKEAIRKETEGSEKADLYFNLGVLYMQVGNETDSIQVELKQSYYQLAEDNFMFAYDLNPDDLEALVGMAQTFENAGKWRRAEKFYRELVTMDPDNPEHFRSMARVLIQQGKQEEAQRYFERYKRISP